MAKLAEKPNTIAELAMTAVYIHMRIIVKSLSIFLQSGVSSQMTGLGVASASRFVLHVPRVRGPKSRVPLCIFSPSLPSPACQMPTRYMLRLHIFFATSYSPSSSFYLILHDGGAQLVSYVAVVCKIPPSYFLCLRCFRTLTLHLNANVLILDTCLHCQKV